MPEYLEKFLSFIRRKPRVLILQILSILVLVNIGFCGFAVYRSHNFRNHPQQSFALKFCEGNWPHNILGRFIIFKPGSEAYDQDLRDWTYKSKRLSDNSWNRWILENNLEKASETACAVSLPHYPLTPTTGLIPPLRKALKRNEYKVLPLLGRISTEESNRLYRQWIEDKIVKPRAHKLFVDASGFITQSMAYPPAQLFEIFWPKLDSIQKERVIAKVAIHFSSEPVVANQIFAWAKRTLFSGGAKISCAAIALLGRFISRVNTRAEAIGIFVQQNQYFESAQIKLLFAFVEEDERTKLAVELLDKIKNINLPVSMELIHYVAHTDIVIAEEMAATFTSGGDSEAKKGAIVMLVRHESTKGKGMIDESFSGNSPRKTLYHYLVPYFKSSDAAAQYKRLSTHDYLQTGKTWPPSYLRHGPSAEEIGGWQRFIASYPWFPGTDDAYYRLAFSQFAQRDYQGCLATIKSYLARGYWPDNDAKPFMMHLLRNLAINSDISDDTMPYIQHIKNIANNPLASMMIGTNQNAGSVIDSINWFLSNPKYIEFLNTDIPTLKLMLEIALVIQASPGNITSIAEKIESADSASLISEGTMSNLTKWEEDSDDENEEDWLIYSCFNKEGDTWNSFPSATLVKSTLYANFIEVSTPESPALKLNIPDDPGELAIRDMAEFLKNRFSVATLDDVQNYRVDETIVLGLLHARSDFQRWEREFQATKDFLTAIDTKYVPKVVSKRHLYLKERM
jgi:hypothetical protein